MSADVSRRGLLTDVASLGIRTGMSGTTKKPYGGPWVMKRAE